MNTRRSLLACLTTAALGLFIGAPTFAAAPSFTGILRCTHAVSGDLEDLNPLAGATRHDIAVWRKYWNQSEFCANGSFDTSGLTQDP